ncbi:hypothetical protein BGZ75_003219 [Mortierella antarctica]|nr:hypothetical protein BGZ75_003219 [Mortierella antarctica]
MAQSLPYLADSSTGARPRITLSTSSTPTYGSGHPQPPTRSAVEATLPALSVATTSLCGELAAQNWVNTFEPSTGSFSSFGPGSGTKGERTIGNNELSNGTRSIVAVLAIAAVGALLALLITIGALMVIRKRNQRRRRGSSSIFASNMMAPALNKTHFGTWDHHLLVRSVNLEKDDKVGLVDNNDINIPAVTGYNPWGRREWTTTVNTIPGITQAQTMIVGTPVTHSKSTKTTSPTHKN